MIVGVDISTFAVHTAWLQDDGAPRRWHCTLGTTKNHVIDRVRNVAMVWPSAITGVAIEMPFSNNRMTNSGLMAVVGAVTKSAPTYCRVTWESAGTYRAAIGCINNKYDAGMAVKRIVWPDIWEDYPPDWSPDELDALVAAVGWQKILAAQDDA